MKKMDDDLEAMLNDMWKLKPNITKEYLTLKAMLLIVQELRYLTSTLSIKRSE